MIFFLLFLAVLIGIAVAGHAYSASKREWSFELATIFTRTFDAIGQGAAVMFGAPFVTMVLIVLEFALLGAFVETSRVTVAGGPPTPMEFALASLVIVMMLPIFALGQVVMVRCAIGVLEEGERPQATAIARAFPATLLATLMLLVQAVALLAASSLLLIPAIILWCMWSVALPCLVREETGVFGSLGRSARLTKGARWSIFLLALVFMAVQIIAVGGAELLALPLGPIGGLIVVVLISSLLATVSAAGIAAIYHELKVQKEGVDTGELETVFA